MWMRNNEGQVYQVPTTWNLVLTTQRGFVAMVVAAPAPDAAIMLAPIDSWWLLSSRFQFDQIREKCKDYRYRNPWNNNYLNSQDK